MTDREANVVITANNSQYNQSVSESTKATEKFNAALQKTSDTASKITKATSKGLLRVGASEIAGLTALSAVAATLEKQTSNIQSNLALNKTASQYNAITASIRAMSREMPMARAEIASMATAVSDLGMLSARQIGGVSKTFNQMQVATGESGIGLATSMVQFQRAMGVAQPTYQTMNPYANSVTGLSARAGTSATDILQFSQSFAPAARVAGMSQSSVLGLSTAATRAGVDGQYAASTISQILNDVTQLRYVNSPELGRYARALGMDSSELTRKTTGPEDQDKFLRNIMSRVVAVAQTEEGPSRLSMMNIDGLRARKALQGLASEPGGIEKWINQAQAGMTQPNVQTGFKAASSGLADQTIMLRNRATDIGQQLGTPVMEALNGVAIGANKLAGAFEPLTNLLTGFVGKIGIPLGVLTMAAGAMYKVWSTASAAILASRVGINTGTSAFGGAILDARGIASGALAKDNDPGLSAWGQRVSDPNAKTSATQRTMYRLGGAVGSATSGWDRPTGVGQGILQGIDRTRQWVQRTTLDWDEKARLSTTDRWAARLEQEKLTEQYKKNLGRYKDELDHIERRNAAAASYGQAGASYAMPLPQRPDVPYDPRTGRPLGYVAPESGKYTIGGVTKGLGEAYVKLPAEAAYTGGTFLGRGARAVGSHFITQPWQEMRANQQELGMRQWSGQRLAGAGAGIASGVGAIAGMATNPLVIAMAAMAGISAVAGARGEYTDWKKKWSSEGGGVASSDLDNLSEYNEKLGLATRSLQQFTKGLDDSNPARSDNINSELKNSGNVQEFGRNMEELVNARLSTVKTVEQAKEWIASQGTMNADTWVLVMRDFSKIFKTNQTAFTELNKWVQENQKDGRVPLANVGTPQLAQRFDETATGGFNIGGSGWRKFFSSPITQFTAAGLGIGALTGGDPSNIRGSEAFQNAGQFLVGSQASQAKTVGETKDASSLFNTDRKLSIDQQTTLTRAEGISQFTKTVNSMLEDIGNTKNIFKLPAKKLELEQYINEGGSAFGIDVRGMKATGLVGHQISGRDTKDDVQEYLKVAINEGAKSDDTLKAIVDAGLVGKVISGSSISSGLKDLTVQTSSQQAVAGTSFENVPEKVFNKYLGEGSLLGKGLLAAGTLSDTTDFANASTKLLEFAKYAEKQQRTSPSSTSAYTGGQTLNKQFAILEEMKINNPEGTQGWELAKAAQAKVVTAQNLENVGKTSLEVRQQELGQVNALTPQLNVDSNKQSQDLMNQLGAAKAKAQGDKQSLMETANAWGISRAREDYDWTINTKRSWDAYYLQRQYSQDDFHRSMKRSQDSFNRQTAQSEATFQRSLKYQSQDFYRSRQREEESYQRQKKYAAEDTAKSIGDPYNRIRLQLLNDPAVMLDQMKNRAGIAEGLNQNIETLKGRGLEQGAINMMGLADFNNAQNTQHLTNTITAEQINEFNSQAKRLTTAGGELNEKDTSTIRAEKERDIALRQGMDDFIRNLKRTKIEHEIQVKWNAKEFAISVKNAEQDHKISLKRAFDQQQLVMDQAAADRSKSLRRQTEDMFGFAEDGIESLKATSGEIMGPKGIIDTFAGGLKDKLGDLVTTTQEIVDAIDVALAKIAKGRAAADKAAAAETKREDTRAEAASAAAKAASQAKIDAASKAGWEDNPPKRSASGAYLVWSPMDQKYVDVRTWQDQYTGFQSTKMAEGGILQAKAGGHRAIMAEAGSAEMAIPLNARGIDFMSTFTKGVAREMVKSLPRTPVSAANISNCYDHSTNVTIDTVEVAANDPKQFIKELKREQGKKRAALYKS
jgi:TP901 family phage tail tape measure protein